MFSLMYAFGYLFGGRLMDWIGVRRGLAMVVGGWSVAAALHGAMSSVIGFKFARGALGLLELAGLASRRGDLWRATTTRGGRR